MWSHENELEGHGGRLGVRLQSIESLMDARFQRNGKECVPGLEEQADASPVMASEIGRFGGSF